MVGVIIPQKNILTWQQTAIENIKKAGWPVVVFYVNECKTRRLPIHLLPLAYAEKKVHGTSIVFLKNSKPANSNDFEKWVNSGSLENLTELICLGSLSSASIADIAKKVNRPVFSLQLSEERHMDIISAVIQAYRLKAATISVNVWRSNPHGDSLAVYNTVCGIEEGLLFKTINSIMAKCALIFVRVLRRHDNTANMKWATPERHIQPFFTAKSPYAQFISHLYDKIFRKRQWIILFGFKNDGHESELELSEITPPSSEFWADPFAVKHNGKYFIFYEGFSFSGRKGYLSVAEIDREGTMLSSRVILEKETHLSFPFIFKHGGKFYMIPETSETKTIELYECTDFPLKWEFKETLIHNIDAVDTVLHYFRDKWWMFTTEKTQSDMSGHEELYIYFSDRLLNGNWMPHPGNPVISDARMGRNAGAIEEKDGKLIRYGQYSGYVYGRAITVSEIEKLSENEYCEKVTSIKLPSKKNCHYGAHTYNVSHDLIVGDALRRLKRFI